VGVVQWEWCSGSGAVLEVVQWEWCSVEWCSGSGAVGAVQCSGEVRRVVQWEWCGASSGSGAVYSRCEPLFDNSSIISKYLTLVLSTNVCCFPARLPRTFLVIQTKKTLLQTCACSTTLLNPIISLGLYVSTGLLPEKYTLNFCFQRHV